MHCRFDNESELTPGQRHEFREQFVQDYLKKDKKIARNILIIISILVISILSIFCDDATVACVIIPLLIATLFTDAE